MDKPRIIICATQRSGSTLLCEDLINNNLGRPGEHFLRVINNDLRNNKEEALRLVESVGTGDNGIFSVKVMSSYLPQIEDILRDPKEQAAEKGKGPLWPAFYREFRDAVWIYVDRRSTLRQAVSRVVAKRTGINHAVASTAATFIPGRSLIGENDPQYNATVSYRAAAIERSIVNIAVERFNWETFFANHSIHPIRVVYEEFVEDLRYIATIRAAAGLAEDRIVDARNLLKLSNEKNEELVESFVADHVRKPSRLNTSAAPRSADNAGRSKNAGADNRQGNPLFRL